MGLAVLDIAVVMKMRTRISDDGSEVLWRLMATCGCNSCPYQTDGILEAWKLGVILAASKE